MSNTFGFVGFGLIAGSIAKSLKENHPDCTIIVSSRSIEPIQQAKSDGVADEIYDKVNNEFSKCDYIFLCTPVVTITEYLKTLKDIIKPGCIITDVGSVKGVVHEAVEALDLNESFIGGHPMTGSEHSGYAYSDSKLLKGAKYVVTPTASTPKDKLDEFIKLVSEFGSNVIVMDWHLHDISVAGISHLPHLASAAVALTVRDNDDDMHYMHSLAAGGFRDTTRIAASSPEMWAQICATNGPAICDMMDKYIELLTEIRNEIKNRSQNSQHTQEYIKQLFTESREYRNTFKF